MRNCTTVDDDLPRNIIEADYIRRKLKPTQRFQGGPARVRQISFIAQPLIDYLPNQVIVKVSHSRPHRCRHRYVGR